MELEQILAIITPALSGLSGLLIAAALFIKRLRNVVRIAKAAIKDNEEIKAELDSTKHQLVELNQKIGFLVEETKKRAKDEKQKSA